MALIHPAWTMSDRLTNDTLDLQYNGYLLLLEVMNAINNTVVFLVFLTNDGDSFCPAK